MAAAQEPVTIDVNRAEKLGPYKSVWSYFGYDEPNYTYTDYGRKLIRELAALGEQRVHIRVEAIL